MQAVFIPLYLSPAIEKEAPLFHRVQDRSVVFKLATVMFEARKPRMMDMRVQIDGACHDFVVEIAVLDVDATRFVLQKRGSSNVLENNVKLACVASNAIRAKG
jgi:hypothetical protein